MKNHQIHISISMILIGICVIIIMILLNELQDRDKQILMFQKITNDYSTFVINTSRKNEWIKVRATGYSIGKPYNQLTALGNPVISKGFLKKGNIDVFTVAADPEIFSLGTILYIDSLGIGIVDDIGPAIQKYELDIVFNSITEAKLWGVKMINVMRLQ